MSAVLVVEDNPANAELVTDLLTAEGHDVVVATDAESGVQLAVERHPDLILMDVSLPGMDGLAATRLLKADPRTRDIVVVALTAHAMRGDETRILAAGCEAYLAKPIDTRRFRATICRLICAIADSTNGDANHRGTR